MSHAYDDLEQELYDKTMDAVVEVLGKDHKHLGIIADKVDYRFGYTFKKYGPNGFYAIIDHWLECYPPQVEGLSNIPDELRQIREAMESIKRKNGDLK